MAYLDKRKKVYDNHITYHYYSKVKNAHWTKGYKNISLKTTDLSIARTRHSEVENNEGAVRDGEDVQWTWIGKTRKPKILARTLGKLVEEWLDYISTNVRASTSDRYRISLNAFMEIIGRSCPLSAINNSTIETFKKYYQNKHTPSGININLRGIKCFLLWAVDEEHIKKMPKIKLLQIDKTKPRIINDAVWDKLMSLCIDEYWKDVFELYRDTGMRRSEGILGRIDGNFLVVKAEHCKTGIEKEIPLSKEQIDVVKEIHRRRNKYLSNGYNITHFKGQFTKMFKMICNKAGVDYSFHSLRHTFAVRRYYQTRDLYLVCKELGHSTITTTEVYAQFNINRLEQEFPSLVNKAKIGSYQTTKVQTPLRLHSNTPR